MISDTLRHVQWVCILLVGLLAFPASSYAQVTESQARELLSQKGISEDTLRARLLAKGINPDNITPADLERFQDEILETVNEIEAEQKNRQSITAAPLNEPLPTEKPVVKEPLSVKKDTVSPLPVKSVSIYGHEIFRNNSLQVYQKAEDLAVSENYMLGTGDKIGVVGFGRSQFEGILVINQDGFVQPGDRLPKILLKGMRFGDAKELLYQRYSQYHVISRNEFQVTLVQARNMTVNVFGEAVTTGSFSLPGINTAFNAISAAGGPTTLGSVRRIKVIRGKETIPLDVYEFMSNPGTAKNYFLQDNDYIHIPVAQKVVTIQGAVNRPMSYELLDNENLVQLLTLAGGAKPQAYLTSVKITRYSNESNIVTNVNLKDLVAAGGDYILYNGDVIEIREVGTSIQNTVSITGAVAYPGYVERREGMKVTDLVAQGVLTPDARLDFAYLLRFQPDSTFKFERINLQEILNQPTSALNVTLNNQDQLKILTLKTFVDPGYFAVVGAVKEPDTFAFNPEGRMKLDEAIILAGGLKQEAADFGYIMRYDPGAPKTLEYIHLDLRKAIEDPLSNANIPVKAGDQIHIYDKTARTDEVTVSVFGAVRNPGKFTYGPGMRLADLISLAGGFKFEADHQRIDIARSTLEKGQSLKINQFTTGLSRDFEAQYESDTTMQLQPFDHIYVRTIPEYEMQRTVEVSGEVKYPGTYALLQDNEKIYDLVMRAGGLTGEAFPEGAKLYRQGDGTGLVVIDLHLIMRDQGNVSNITLREGDILQIPKSRDLVTIGGYVNLDEAYGQGFLTGERSISVAFRGEKSAKYYIDKFAAGISHDGSLSQIKVQYADGRVQKTKKFLFFNDYPSIKKGAYVTVGPKKVKPTVERTEKKTDWGSVLRDTMYQATAVLTLLILVDELAN
jgi:protein involved in polysaccharide export with SLBB domain